MWLERLSGQSNASNAPLQPHSRSYSPSPRRPSHLAPQTPSQRPGFSPRASSLSLVSNDSATSLLGGSKKSNGSGLKQTTAIANHPEPLEVLQKLLGSGIKGVDKNGVLGHDVDLELGNELDFRGLSLREFTELKPQESDDVHLYVPQTVEECMYFVNYGSCSAHAL